MRCELVGFPSGEIAVWQAEGSEVIASVSDFLDLMASSPAETLALRREALSPKFFELQSGLAGEMLQKISNYRRRLVILGDFSSLSSRALRDFIYESNRTGQVVFAAELEEAARLLRPTRPGA